MTSEWNNDALARAYALVEVELGAFPRLSDSQAAISLRKALDAIEKADVQIAWRDA